MMAVLNGASETGTQELGDPVESVEAHLAKGAILVVSSGKKMLLVLHINDGGDAASARTKAKEAGRRLAELF
jgi:predicted regulator of Ras-like GTPase activity (Roadblock/LC7/MglB family)